MTILELKAILSLHKLWLDGDEKGVRANLSRANLSGANLIRANLSRANLIRADLSRANLSGADLSGSNLSGSNLSGAKLSGSNLSGAKGLLDSKSWLSDNFKKTKKGYIVYKAFFNTMYNEPSYWKIKEKSYIEEIVNSNRTNECGCGVNFGTFEYVCEKFRQSQIWECLIEFEDLINVIVPYTTDGKARCGRLKLIKKIK